VSDGVAALSACFDPPEGYTGDFGWLCGYSGDAAFLTLAAERFTRLSRAQRAHEGRVWLGVALDPGNPHVSPRDAPGVLHLPLRRAGGLPYRLLHAKVALLSFAPADGQRPDDWALRLVVSTGNWTRKTLEESLDLCWTLELTAAELAGDAPAVRLACCDLREAWRLLEAVLEHYDARVLDALPGGVGELNRAAERRLRGQLKRAGRRAAGSDRRFVHNRHSALSRQLPGWVAATAGGTKRDYILLGSGFFEGGGAPGRPPRVVSTILSQLRESALLTKSAAVDLVVNPAACQQVAAGAEGIAEAGWAVRAAADPDAGRGLARSLHAKFILSGRAHKDKDSCRSSWLYLGSANLTHPGFLRRAGSEGNLEAGVILSTGQLSWSEISRRLPVDWSAPPLQSTPGALSAGGGPPEREGMWAAPPFPFLLLEVEGAARWLRPPPDVPDAPEVSALDPEGAPCPRGPDGRYAWAGPAPTEVSLRWTEGGAELRARVPIVDDFGRLCTRPLAGLSFAEIALELRAFPQPPEDEELGEEDEAGEEGAPPEAAAGGAAAGGPHHVAVIRRVMALLEEIAALQTRLSPGEWSAWCVRLEQSLRRASEDPTVQALVPLGLNPLGVLLRPEFLPPFARAPSDAHRDYAALIERVQVAWGVAALPPLLPTAGAP
jgi:hypothetical protein